MLNFNDIVERIRGDEEDELVEGPGDDVVTFSTYKEDYGAVPEPIPASEADAEWFDGNDVKVSDSLNEGWIVPLPADVWINAKSPDEGDVSWSNNFHRKSITTHSPRQVGDNFNIPVAILKFQSYWAVDVPEGYSVLITQPFNRKDRRFTQFSGVVDYDKFCTMTHIPFIWEDENFNGRLERGMPIAQLIPFKRDELVRTARVRTATEEEEKEIETSKRVTNSGYSRGPWRPKLTTTDVEPLE